MNKTMKRLLIILFISPYILWAQGNAPWSLDQCVRYAQEHNLAVRQSAIAQQQSAVQLNTALNSVWPSLQASASQSFSFGRGISEDNTYVSSNTANTSFGIGGSLDLFTGLRVKNNIAMGKLNLAAATADLEKAKEDVEVAVIQQYVQILYNQEISRVAQAQIDIDSQQVARLTALVDMGKASVSQLAAQQSTLAQDRLTYTQAVNNLRMATLEMAQLLELPSPEGFSVEVPDVATFALQTIPTPDQIYADALQSKAAVQSENIRLEYAETNIKLAKSSYYPTLSMSGGLVTDYYALLGVTGRGFGEQLKNNFSPYVGLSLNVPIFDRLVTRNNVKTAQLQYDNQRLAVERVQQNLYKEIQQAYYATIAAHDKYESSKAAVESAQQAFDLIQAKYESGKATLTEFNEAKNNYLKASSNMVQAQYEYMFQVKLVEFYRGK